MAAIGWRQAQLFYSDRKLACSLHQIASHTVTLCFSHGEALQEGCLKGHMHVPKQ